MRIEPDLNIALGWFIFFCNCSGLFLAIALDCFAIALDFFFQLSQQTFCQGKIFSNEICTMWVEDRDRVQNPALSRSGPSPNFLVSLAELWVLELSLIKSLIHIFMASNDLWGRTSSII